MTTYCILGTGGVVLTTFANSQPGNTYTGYTEVPVDGGQPGQVWNGTAFVAGQPSPTAVYAAAIAAGLAVTSTATPTLNATYSIDPESQANLAGIAASIAASQGLPDGNATIAWLDSAGIAHSFTAAQFLTLADAVRNYVYGLILTKATLLAGGQASWPAATATIP